MTIEVWLMLLESVLLVATVVLVVYNIYEGKQRDRLLTEVSRATKVFMRQEYFLFLMDSMLDAQQVRRFRPYPTATRFWSSVTARIRGRIRTGTT